MSTRTKKIGESLLAVFFALISGTALFALSVGVISKHGFPIPFAFTAPGYAWTQFDGIAALTNYVTLVTLMFVLLTVLRQATKPRKPSDSATTQKA